MVIYIYLRIYCVFFTLVYLASHTSNTELCPSLRTAFNVGLLVVVLSLGLKISLF